MLMPLLDVDHDVGIQNFWHWPGMSILFQIRIFIKWVVTIEQVDFAGDITWLCT